MALGILAGSGRFPILAAQNARQKGDDVFVVGIEGITSPELQSIAKECLFVHFGELTKTIRFFKKLNVHNIMLAGNIEHTRALNSIQSLKGLLDLKALKILATVPERSANHLMKAIIKEFEDSGLKILPSYSYLENNLFPEGSVTKQHPDSQQRKDIQKGLGAAKLLSQLDIGLTVCVANGVILAVEALEGTDECILRARQILKKSSHDVSFTVVKVARPDQDPRFDLPIIGPKTIETLSKARSSCMAVEAKWTLMLDRDETIQLANERAIALIGMKME